MRKHLTARQIYLSTWPCRTALLMVLVAPQWLFGQTVLSAQACALLGAGSIPAGTVATYSLAGCRATTWQVGCGVISAQSDSSVTVYLNAGTCSSVVVTALKNGSVLATKSISVNQGISLSAGSITSGNQTIVKQSSPAPLDATVAASGFCNGLYTYQWYGSTDSVHFVLIPGANGRQYQPGPLDSTTWFKRQTTCSGSVSFTGNIVTVHIVPKIKVDSMLPDVQMLNTGVAPLAISLSPVSGGLGNYTYQWQSNHASRTAAWQTIPGATSTSYLPGTPDSTTYYRVLIYSKGDSGYSPEAVVGVYPTLVGGGVLPANQTVTFDSIPVELSLSGHSGGNGAFTYQWYSSPDGTNWSPMQGVVTAEYGPAGNLATTYYRVAVTSNGMTAMSASAVVTIPAASATTNQ